MDGIDPRRTRRRISRAVAGFGSGALSSWANQSLDNSGQPIFQAITDINWAKVGLDGGMSMLSGKLGAATGVIGRNLCTSGKACSFLIESVMEAVDSGGTQLVENVLDGDSSTGVFDNVAQACLMGAVFGGVQGGLKTLKAHSPDTGNSGGSNRSRITDDEVADALNGRLNPTIENKIITALKSSDKGKLAEGNTAYDLYRDGIDIEDFQREFPDINNPNNTGGDVDLETSKALIEIASGKNSGNKSQQMEKYKWAHVNPSNKPRVLYATHKDFSIHAIKGMQATGVIVIRSYPELLDYLKN